MGETKALVERLRAYGSRGHAFMGQYVLCSEAADTIERQEREIERLQIVIAALREELDGRGTVHIATPEPAGPHEGGET